MVNPEANFWKSKRVVLTGHTGFKGAWLGWWLSRLGAEVVGIAIEPPSKPNLFSALNLGTILQHRVCDIRNADLTQRLVQEAKPDVVFHMAAQALVRSSYTNTVETFATNVMGTAHVLQALRGSDGCKAVVMVTTDKVYQNNEWCWPYRETDRLGGHDPYSASKAASEIIINSYRSSFLQAQGTSVASARAGNVIGGGDWSMDRLIPDAVRAWSQNQALAIRSPDSVRPWQHVLEPLNAYLQLAQSLYQDDSKAGAYNFGPNSSSTASVRVVAERARTSFGQGEIAFAANLASLHEARLLSLDVSKARSELGIQSRLSLEKSIDMTMLWYKNYLEGVDAQDLCEADLRLFSEVSAS
jgi:CDP-glucose 4,6-dehydratase